MFIGTTSCFRLGPLKSGMFCKVNNNVKITRFRLQGGNGKVGMASWRLESRERLPNWKMLGAGRGCLGGGGLWGIMCVEWRHPGSVKIYGKIMSLLIGPDTTFIRKESVFANMAGHYIYLEGKCPC